MPRTSVELSFPLGEMVPARRGGAIRLRADEGPLLQMSNLMLDGITPKALGERRCAGLSGFFMRGQSSQA